MLYYVSRQRYFGVSEEDETIVEIVRGGANYANPGQLDSIWPSLGEGKEFKDPREAVEAGIAICEAWKKFCPHAQVAFGSTGGCTLPLEPQSYDNLIKLAEEEYNKLPKCGECGDLIDKDLFSHDFCLDEKFCSSRCANKNYYKIINFNE